MPPTPLPDIEVLAKLTLTRIREAAKAAAISIPTHYRTKAAIIGFLTLHSRGETVDDDYIETDPPAAQASGTQDFAAVLKLLQEQQAQQQQLLLQLMRQQRPQLPKPTLQKMSPSDDVENYLAAFERIATQQQWEKDIWPTQLAGLLAGRPLDAFARLSTEDATNYDLVKAAILEECDLDPEGHRRRLRQEKLKQDESVKSFTQRLSRFASRWLEMPEDSLAVQKIVSEQLLDSVDSSTKTRMLEQRNTDLKELVESLEQYRRAHTIVAKKSTAKSQEESRSNTQHAPKQQPPNGSSSTSNGKPFPEVCKGCGVKPGHNRYKQCPAWNQICGSCGKKGHFTNVCKQTSSESSSAAVCALEIDDHCLPVFSVDRHSTYSVKINGKSLPFIIDSGSKATTLTVDCFRSLEPKPKLQTTLCQLQPYGSTPIRPQGVFYALLESENLFTVEPVYVISQAKDSLLSRSASEKLGLLSIKASNKAEENTHTDLEALKNQYPSCFKGIGKHPTQLKLHIDEKVLPRAQSARPIPFARRSQVDEALKEYLDHGIIEKAEGPTPWVSPIVVVPRPRQPNRVRLCTDMRLANHAIQRERHPLPTLEDMIHVANGATVFSQLDLYNGYNQIELHPESRSITTFATHKGLFRHKRLSFGINSACEHFQKIISQTISGIPGVINLVDDLLICGSNRQEHDERLHQVMKRLQEYHLTLNPQKCKIAVPEVVYFGHVFSAEGIRIDPAKIEAISNAGRPQDKQQLHSFLGLASYCAAFVPNLSTLTAPLRALIRRNTRWNWTEEAEVAFKAIRNQIARAPTRAYFDPASETILWTDASNFGLAAILTQKRSHGTVLIACASRSLSDVETRYSATEKEALAVTYGCERFQQYLCGLKFEIITDHQALTFLTKKVSPPQGIRLQRWLLRLQQFDFKLSYRKGKENPADYLSRHPVQSPSNIEQLEELQDDATWTAFTLEAAVPNAITIQAVQQATKADNLLQRVLKRVHENNWSHLQEDEKLFSQYKTDLSIVDNILLKGHRVVMPAKLQDAALKIAHLAHQGVQKTKALANSKIWFPRINKKIENLVKNCRVCAENTPDRTPRQSIPVHIAPGPWNTVSLDFFGPLKGHRYWFVLIDDYTHYPVVWEVSSTSASVVIKRLEELFSLFGIPAFLRSDGGPPFQSKDFQRYMSENGITHRKSTPLWPQGNGIVERFMQPLKKLLRSEGGNRTSLMNFLRQYRATPHTTTGQAPHQLLFADRTPTPSKLLPTATCTTKPKLQVGNKVLMKRANPLKHESLYEASPYIVDDVKGNRVTIHNEDRILQRDSSFLKQI